MPVEPTGITYADIANALRHMQLTTPQAQELLALISKALVSGLVAETGTQMQLPVADPTPMEELIKAMDWETNKIKYDILMKTMNPMYIKHDNGYSIVPETFYPAPEPTKPAPLTGLTVDPKKNDGIVHCHYCFEGMCYTKVLCPLPTKTLDHYDCYAANPGMKIWCPVHQPKLADIEVPSNLYSHAHVCRFPGCKETFACYQSTKNMQVKDCNFIQGEAIGGRLCPKHMAAHKAGQTTIVHPIPVATGHWHSCAKLECGMVVKCIDGSEKHDDCAYLTKSGNDQVIWLCDTHKDEPHPVPTPAVGQYNHYTMLSDTPRMYVVSHIPYIEYK